MLDQDFPNLYDQKRIGVTNVLSVRVDEAERVVEGSGNARELLLFLSPSNNQSSTIYFPPDKIELAQQNSVRKLINELLQEQSTELGKVQNYDIYILRVASSHHGSGPSSGVAHYLALYSALNKIPLPRRLASTATIKGTEVGRIGGLKNKLQGSIKKGMDTFILCEGNEKDIAKRNGEGKLVFLFSDLESKIKQIHFISQVNQIGIALLEILKEPNRHIVHSCGKSPEPRRGPENPEPEEDPNENPSSSITPEQLLSLVAEFHLREVAEDLRDFKNKLMSACHANEESYQKAVQDVLQIHQKFLQKFQKAEKSGSTVDEKKEQEKLNKLKKKSLDFINRLEKRQEKKEKLNEAEEKNFEIESNQIVGLIKKNQWLEETFESLPYPEGTKKEEKAS